jgi:hypothetical protein
VLAIIIFAFVLAYMTLILYTLAAPNYENMQIQADGLFEEKLLPASLGDRQIALSTKIYPPLLTNETSDIQKYVQFGLTETNLANKSIPHVYYYITITEEDKLLLKELFHSHSGNLTLNLHEKNNTTVNTTISNGDKNILAAREAVMGAWTSFDNTDNITVLTPIFSEGGLYNFKVEILGIDNDTNIFKAINSLEFDSRLSVGNIHEYDIDYQGAKNNVTIISYYDSIKNFSYSPEDEVLTWYMPFDWDIDRLEKDQNILVHNEIQIPKNWFANDGEDAVGNNASNNGNTTIASAIGKVNNERLGGRSFVIDPYSSQDSITFHYILGKNYLVNLAQNQTMNSNSTSSQTDDDNTNNDGHMKFELGGF